VPPNPVYGGRYHWVVSGMASVMERDHRFLPIKDEGAYVVMQPAARNYDDSTFAPQCAAHARDRQTTLVTVVPDGQYAATAQENPHAADLKQAFEKGAIWFYANHGGDDGTYAWVKGSGPSWLYTADPGLNNPDVLWVSGPGGLNNPTQCHLAVFYVCHAGPRFADVLVPQGVDCVVGTPDEISGSPIANTWSEAFWEHLRKGGYVTDALVIAREKVHDMHNGYYGTEALTWWGLSTEVIVYARYQ